MAERTTTGRSRRPSAPMSMPNLVILDAMLPNRNGIETMRELRCDTQFEATPVIMLTSVADSKAVRMALRSVASDYIRKDASVDEGKERLLLYLG